MVKVRARLWVPNQFPGGPGSPDRCPAILVGPNLLLVRHSTFPRALAAIPGSAVPDLGINAPTWTAEPLGKRPTMDRDLSRGARYDFDAWAPTAGFLRFVPKGKKAAARWSLSLRSQLELPWAVVGAGEGDLASLLEAVRELVKAEDHELPPIMVEPKTPNICPADDLPHIPQHKALAAVEGLISRIVVSRP